jgi:AcrR family transcriptional regulator
VARGGDTGTRRRRTPEAAQAEIVAAAEALLRERPFRDLTVDEVMRRTGLSRPSFYVYFKDRHALVLRVVEHLQGELLEVANRWYASMSGGRDELQDAIEGFVAVYRQHGPVMRALADAAADDVDVEAAYAALIQTFVDATAAHLGTEAEAGSMPPVNAPEVAKALTWMTERYLYHSHAPGAEVGAGTVVETLATILTRVVYPRS